MKWLCKIVIHLFRHISSHGSTMSALKGHKEKHTRNYRCACGRRHKTVEVFRNWEYNEQWTTITIKKGKPIGGAPSMRRMRNE